MAYHLPASIEEALAAVQVSGGDFAFVAGGTDLMVQVRQGTTAPAHLIDISRIAALRAITSDGGLRLGAGVTLASIEGDATLRARYPAIVAAAHAVASPLIRAGATLGGNLLCENRCVFYDQSEFWRHAVGYCLKCGGDVCIATAGTKNCYSVCVSDLAPVLICLDARVEYIDAHGEGTASVEELYTGDGAEPHALPRGALVTAVVIPHASDGGTTFRKLRPRASVDFTNLTMAVRRDAGRLTIALTGVAARPVVVRTDADNTPEEVIPLLTRDSTIIDNLAFSRVYRKEMVGAFLRDALST